MTTSTPAGGSKQPALPVAPAPRAGTPHSSLQAAPASGASPSYQRDASHTGPLPTATDLIGGATELGPPPSPPSPHAKGKPKAPLEPEATPFDHAHEALELNKKTHETARLANATLDTSVENISKRLGRVAEAPTEARKLSTSALERMSRLTDKVESTATARKSILDKSAIHALSAAAELASVAEHGQKLAALLTKQPVDWTRACVELTALATNLMTASASLIEAAEKNPQIHALLKRAPYLKPLLESANGPMNIATGMLDLVDQIKEGQEKGWSASMELAVVGDISQVLGGTLMVCGLCGAPELIPVGEACVGLGAALGVGAAILEDPMKVVRFGGGLVHRAHELETQHPWLGAVLPGLALVALADSHGERPDDHGAVHK